MSIFKKLSWGGAAVLLAMVMALGLVARPAMAATPATVTVYLDTDQAANSVASPLTDARVIPVAAIIKDADNIMSNETIVTFSTSSGTFANSGTSTQNIQCAADAANGDTNDGGIAAAVFDAGFDAITFSPTQTGTYNGEAAVVAVNDLVADDTEEGCIGVTASLVVPKNQPTGQIIITASTTNGKSASVILTITAALSTNDPSTIGVISGQPQNDNIGYTSSTAQYNPVANGTRWGIEVKDSDGNRINGLSIQFSTDNGVLKDDVLADSGTADTENHCDSTTDLGTTAFSTTAGTGTSAGRAYVILCGTSGSAGKTATITATVTSKTSLTASTKVGIAAKPTSADIKATVDGSIVNVEIMVGGIPAPKNTSVHFAVVPTTDGAVGSSCVSLQNGKASTSVAATPGKAIQVLVTAGEVADPGISADDGTADAATLCGTDARTYGSTTVVVGAGGTTPPATGAGTFASAPVFSASKQALAVFNGGTVAQLEAAVTAAGGTGVWAQDSKGAFVLDIIGGGFVNDAFKAAFTAGVPASTAVTVIGK